MVGKLATVAGALIGAWVLLSAPELPPTQQAQVGPVSRIESLVAPPPAVEGFVRHVPLADSGQWAPDLLLRSDGESRLTLVMIGGSLCEPVLQRVQVGKRTGVVAGAPLLSASQQDALGVHVALLDRRGLRSLDADAPTRDAESMQLIEPKACSDEEGGVTLEQREADVRAQLDYLRSLQEVRQLILVGSSEGADVAAAVAVGRVDIRGLILLSGMGVSQLFDMLQRARYSEETSVQAQLDAIAGLLDGRRDLQWMGHDAARWKSFAVRHTPLQSLLKSRVPVMIVHGVLDEQVPIASADAAVIELIRQQPNRSVYYWSLPGVGHALLDSNQQPLASALIAEGVSWMSAEWPARTLRHAPLPTR